MLNEVPNNSDVKRVANIVLNEAPNSNAELEIAVGHWPFSTNFSHLAEQIQLARPYLLNFSNGEPLIAYCIIPAFKEWPTNFKLLFQALQ